MQSSSIALSSVHVYPKHCIALQRLESHTSIVFNVTVYKLAPLLISRCSEQWEIRSSPSNIISLDVCEERAHSVAAVGRRGVCRVREPICMEVVMFCDGILDELDWFEMRFWVFVALEQQGALLYASDDGIPLDGCRL